MKKYSILFVFIAIYSVALAQKHDYNWVYGYGYKGVPIDSSSKAGGGIIDFNVSPPALKKADLILNFGYSALACSDSSGRFLFYSNGDRIFNHRYRLMENGDTINPGPFWKGNGPLGSSASAFGWCCIPAPGLKNCYYFFSPAISQTGNRIYCGPLYYALIDMQANNGEGKVLKKNQLMLDDSIQRISLTKHANGRDWWLLVPYDRKQKYARFLITPEGIQTLPAQIIGDEFFQDDGTSSCLFSPDGTRYIRPDVYKGIYLFDFNRCTGELSNYYLMPEKDGRFIVGFCEFSPDSRFLYVNRPGMVVRLDLDAPNFGYYAIDTIQRFDYYYYPFSLFPVGFSGPKLAPDGKIYYSASSTTRWMHVVHRPNLPGSACDVENHGLLLPRYNNSTICPAPNYRLGVWEGSPCDTMGRHPADGGFQKTSYEAFLERQAKGLSPPIEASHPQPPPMPPISNDRLEHRINVSKSTFSDHEK